MAAEATAHVLKCPSYKIASLEQPPLWEMGCRLAVLRKLSDNLIHPNTISTRNPGRASTEVEHNTRLEKASIRKTKIDSYFRSVV